MNKDTKSRIQRLLEQADEIDKDVASFTTSDDLLRGILRTNIAIVELLIGAQTDAEPVELDVNGIDAMGNPVCGARIRLDTSVRSHVYRCVSEAHGDEWPHKVELPASI